MSRKGMPFLLAGVTLAATMLAPHTAGATEAKVRAGTSRTPTPVSGPTGFISCAAGYHPSPFEMPIYDADGRFVIGHKTVWFCIPDDLEPAG
ncbi:MAG TPA: hypothetical protein VF244_05095 [Acidimicrobiales bacterium]